MKFLFKVILVVLAISVMIGSAFVGSAPSLPPGTSDIIEEIEKKEPTELLIGIPGFAQNGNINIWYEQLVPRDSVRGTILLIMGHSTTGINWTENFCGPLVEAGYRVIRYDNRGVGLSDWILDWDKDQPYSLEDMAADGIAILDKIGVQKAHIAGASMGGMIAQRIAISYPNRAESLTSIMSSGYMLDPELPPVPSKFTSNLTKLGLKYLVFTNEKKVMKFAVAMAGLLKGKGDYKTDVAQIANRTLYELRKRKGFNTDVGDQHSAAIEVSGSRYAELPTLAVPTLVVHGTDDPLVIPAHAEKYAPMIPDAKMLWVEGMGHDIPPEYTPEVHQAMFDIIEKSTALKPKI